MLVNYIYTAYFGHRTRPSSPAWSLIPGASSVRKLRQLSTFSMDMIITQPSYGPSWSTRRHWPFPNIMDIIYQIWSLRHWKLSSTNLILPFFFTLKMLPLRRYSSFSCKKPNVTKSCAMHSYKNQEDKKNCIHVFYSGPPCISSQQHYLPA